MDVARTENDGNTPMIAVVEIGSQTIKVAVGCHSRREGMTTIKAFAESPSAGLGRDRVTNIRFLAQAIEEAVQQCESRSSVPIEEVFIGVKGASLNNDVIIGEKVTDMVPVWSNSITEEDIGRVLRRIVEGRDNRRRLRIIHALEQEFQVDGVDSVESPLNMTGEHLRGYFYLISAQERFCENLEACCEQVGLSVVQIVFQPYAAALGLFANGAVSSSRESVLVVDMGARSTGSVLYHGGVIENLATVPFGGHHISKDIAQGLGIPFEEAERVKRECGSALVEFFTEEETFTVNVSNDQQKLVASQLLARIIRARVEEIFEQLRKEIQKKQLEPVSYISLVGGSAHLRNITPVIRDVFGVAVGLDVPTDIDGATELVSDASYAGLVGLLRFGLDYKPNPYLQEHSATNTEESGFSFKKFLKNYF